MSRVKRAFKPVELLLPIASFIPRDEIPPGFRRSATYRQMAASIEHLGLIESVIVYPHGQDRYLLLDGHIRVDILKSREVAEVRAIVATEDEAYTYNKRVNHAPAIAQHFMILKALELGVSEERIAKALDRNIAEIRQRRDMLDGICPEAVEILKTKEVTANAFGVLRKMRPLRQIEAAEHMVANGTYSVKFAKFLLSITAPEMLLEPVTEKRVEATSKGASAMLQQEMEALLKDFKAVEDSYGTESLSLTVICGYVGRLLANPKVEKYLAKHQPDILGVLRSTVAESKSAKAQKA